MGGEEGGGEFVGMGVHVGPMKYTSYPSGSQPNGKKCPPYLVAFWFEGSLRCGQARCGKTMYFARTMAIHNITTRTVTMSVCLLLSNRHGSGTRQANSGLSSIIIPLCVGAKNVKKIKKNLSCMFWMCIYMLFSLNE